MTCPFNGCERIVTARPLRVPANRTRSESGLKQLPNGASTALIVSPEVLKLPSRPVSAPVTPPAGRTLQFAPEGTIVSAGEGAGAGGVGDVGGAAPPGEPPHATRASASTAADQDETRFNMFCR